MKMRERNPIVPYQITGTPNPLANPLDDSFFILSKPKHDAFIF
jgi:hypothetical protein